jgi:hypothetical protein
VQKSVLGLANLHQLIDSIIIDHIKQLPMHLIFDDFNKLTFEYKSLLQA